MGIRIVQAWIDGRPAHVNKEWVPYDKISPQLVRAVIASEDNLFPQHNGFSFDAIKKAMEINKKGRHIHGGSTISQQTAKNVFLTPSRTYIRKAFEAYFTVLIELVWGKQRIMEVYLNVIEMGDGIYGAQAAAETFFHTSAKNLNTSQSALIAVCLPNPRRYRINHPSNYIQRRQAHIMDIMYKLGPISLKHRLL